MAMVLPRSQRRELGSFFMAGLSQPEHVMDRIDELERRLQEAQEAIRDLRSRLARAERNASTDSLTGIANRRGFSELLQGAVAEAARRHEALSLLMIDIDHFKDFNDRYGHHIGDHVLRLVATALASLPGGAKAASRFGGEEFAVILPNVALHEALALAERTRTSLAARRFIMRGSGEALSQITISIGVAELRSREHSEGLVRRADAALYRAKRAGRNCVVSDGPLATARTA
jgi:diguanylate cyclase